MNEKLIEQVKSEISFLTGENMKWLVHEADIGTYHAEYLPLVRRVSKLKKKLKSLLHRTKSPKSNKCFTATPEASPKSCLRCMGSGELIEIFTDEISTCPDCNGTGKTP